MASKIKEDNMFPLLPDETFFPSCILFVQKPLSTIHLLILIDCLAYLLPIYLPIVGFIFLNHTVHYVTPFLTTSRCIAASFNSQRPPSWSGFDNGVAHPSSGLHFHNIIKSILSFNHTSLFTFQLR